MRWHLFNSGEKLQQCQHYHHHHRCRSGSCGEKADIEQNKQSVTDQIKKLELYLFINIYSALFSLQCCVYLFTYECFYQLKLLWKTYVEVIPWFLSNKKIAQLCILILVSWIFSVKILFPSNKQQLYFSKLNHVFKHKNSNFNNLSHIM